MKNNGKGREMTGEKEKVAVRVWSVKMNGNQDVRVATIEQLERKPGMCKGCEAPCCRGILRPVLTQDEFHNRRFPTLFLNPPEWIKEKAPRAQAIATLGMSQDGPCSFLDTEKNQCKAWPNCPKSCLAYDCREDTRDEIKEFAKARAEKWPEQ